jgi:putative transposase
MPMKRYKAEQIVTLLRQIEVGIANGKPTPQACKEAEITIPTYYRWRKEYGGLKLNQAKRMKELERENTNIGCMGSLLGVSESASAEFSFFYTKRSSFDLYIQTNRELRQTIAN